MKLCVFQGYSANDCRIYNRTSVGKTEYWLKFFKNFLFIYYLLLDYLASFFFKQTFFFI